VWNHFGISRPIVVTNPYIFEINGMDFCGAVPWINGTDFYGAVPWINGIDFYDAVPR
jgi:hypothetical protein